tara:strand:- start:341 stop:625 length:285 start_codon:yes stop_codon:yes gene_type:complete
MARPKKKKLEDRPLRVGDYVKVKLSGLGADAYVVEEIHTKQNSKGETVLHNFTVIQEEVQPNGRYVHRIGENGTMFATGKPGIRTNLKSRLVRV